MEIKKIEDMNERKQSDSAQEYLYGKYAKVIEKTNEQANELLGLLNIIKDMKEKDLTVSKKNNLLSDRIELENELDNSMNDLVKKWEQLKNN